MLCFALRADTTLDWNSFLFFNTAYRNFSIFSVAHKTLFNWDWLTFLEKSDQPNLFKVWRHTEDIMNKIFFLVALQINLMRCFQPSIIFLMWKFHKSHVITQNLNSLTDFNEWKNLESFNWFCQQIVES